MARRRKRPGMVKEFWGFIKHRKIWWLSPIILLLVALTALIFATEASVLAPYIYALF